LLRTSRHCAALLRLPHGLVAANAVEKAGGPVTRRDHRRFTCPLEVNLDAGRGFPTSGRRSCGVYDDTLVRARSVVLAVAARVLSIVSDHRR
jgi:hypothetical protein